MLYIIAYDIADACRLRRVAKCCELYGGRIEKSVFELELDDKIFQRFWTEVRELLDLEKDALVAYKICATCEKGIQSLGKVRRRPKGNMIFIG